MAFMFAAREIFKEKVAQDVKQHAGKFAELSAWIADKQAYLQTKEAIASVAEARTQLSLLDTFDKDQAAYTENRVAPLKKLGDAIRSAKVCA